jgi:hypothetical protein
MIAGKILEVGIGRMQGIVYHRFGSPDVLELPEIPKSTPAEGVPRMKCQSFGFTETA